MMPEVREQILYVLGKVPKIINDVPQLFDLSNFSIHSASIHQDSDSITVAVVVYAVAKIASRCKSDRSKDWKQICPPIVDEIENARKQLENEDYQKYRKSIRDIISIISKVDKDLKQYIEKVIEKAKIKKGSGLYERGLSAERAAKLMGISVWEMMNYIGKTQIFDEAKIKSDVNAKIKLAKELFNFE